MSDAFTPTTNTPAGLDEGWDLAGPSRRQDTMHQVCGRKLRLLFTTLLTEVPKSLSLQLPMFSEGFFVSKTHPQILSYVFGHLLGLVQLLGAEMSSTRPLACSKFSEIFPAPFMHGGKMDITQTLY